MFSIGLLSIYNVVNKYCIKIIRVQLCKLKYAFLKFCCNTECSRKKICISREELFNVPVFDRTIGHRQAVDEL